MSGNSKLAKYLMISIVLIFTFILGGCSLFPREKEVNAPPLVKPSEIKYNTIKASKGTIIKSTSSNGVFVSRNQENVSFKQRSGYLKDVCVGVGEHVKKGQVLGELDSDSILNQIKIQEIKLEQARISLAELENNKADEFEIKKAKLAVEMEEITLEGLKNELSKLKLAATISGEIIYQGNVKIGDFIEPSTTIFTIADLNNLQLEIQTADFFMYKVGMKVNVTFNDTNYQGEIVEVPTIVNDKNKKKEATPPPQSIYIRVNNISGKVKLGDQASVVLTTEKKENVIVLPKNAVHIYEDQAYIQILENNIIVERFIEPGIITNTEVEIVNGVKEGEEIIQE